MDVRTGCCEADLEDDTEKELALPCVNSNVRKGPVTEQNLRSGVKGVVEIPNYYHSLPLNPSSSGLGVSHSKRTDLFGYSLRTWESLARGHHCSYIQ